MLNRKRLMIGAAVATAVMMPSAAFAAGVNNPGYSTPGSTVAQDHTICAGHGAFGAFGNFGDPHDFGINNLGTNGLPGASSFKRPGTGGTTGGNNSALCGNQATPPPFSS